MDDESDSSAKRQHDETTPQAVDAPGLRDASEPARDDAPLTRVFTTWEKARLQLFRVHDVVFDNVDFVGADLRGGRFERVSLRGADFSGSDLRGARFVGCDLRGARLHGVELGGTRFLGSRLAGVTGLTKNQMLYLYTRAVRTAARSVGR